MKLTNSYFQLGAEFYQKVQPIPVPNPKLLLWNDGLARQLHISEEVKNNAGSYFSGNQLLADSIPIATAYAGHQFGGFNPQLGDGRAHLLGELNYNDGKEDKKVELQLKGSGQSKFSRRGDGRCALKPAVREYIMSEAMHALGIPTTRALSVITTGEEVLRNGLEPGAIVSRVAASHIRIGTFQYFASKGDIPSLKTLLNFAIQRHFPEIDTQQAEPDKAILFLQAVINKQIKTIVHWMRVGFIHGVMNTDNMTISGETIDYGPCAMMGVYNPETVFSSIDDAGRYCYINQPAITQWNLARLAETLLPLIHSDIEQAVKQVEPYITQFSEQYIEAYYQMMTKKLGIYCTEGILTPDRELVDQLLDIMQRHELDYTQTFIYLMGVLDETMSFPTAENDFNQKLATWRPAWLEKIKAKTSLQQMRSVNPLVIPRNHHIEAVLNECQSGLTAEPVDELLTVLRLPYEMQAKTPYYQGLSKEYDKRYQTFCGT